MWSVGCIVVGVGLRCFCLAVPLLDAPAFHDETLIVHKLSSGKLTAHIDVFE